MRFVWAIIFLFFIRLEGRKDEFYDILEMVKDYKESFQKPEIFDSYFNMTDLEEFPNVCDDYEDEECAKAWLKEVDIIKKRNVNRMSNINFKYATNINKKNGKIKLKMNNQYIIIYKNLKTKLLRFQWQTFQSPELRRIFRLITPTFKYTNETYIKRMIDISQRIENIYNNGRPCFGKCLGKGETDIVRLFRKEKDYDKLSGFWSSWRNVTGRRIKNLFIEKINLEKLQAEENGYSDLASQELKEDFEESNFNETILRLYEEILPLYKQIHGYVRYCLARFYVDRFDPKGPIPAHILGNVWAQQWHNIMPILQKCRGNITVYNIQDQADRKIRSISVRQMFKIAENFYKSIGMYEMTPTFWERSVISQQSGRLINCHGSAYNFHNTVDFRIKMCTEKDFNDFSTIHHEMGHIEYYMAYRKLLFPFQTSANPGFHEAIGDTITLSVKTPKHLKKIGFIQSYPSTEEFDIDYLFSTALEKVVFLPFALTMDSYIWSLSNGSVSNNKLNEHWWNLRYRFQGIKPPIPRTEDDFDPGAKYHIAFGCSYIRYFASTFHQFQFYEAMCKLSGNSEPLHRCDFYQSKAAGRTFLKMLKKGRSQHWRDSLELLTGSRDITSEPLMKYFEPLYEWLKETNERLNIPIGW